MPTQHKVIHKVPMSSTERLESVIPASWLCSQEAASLEALFASGPLFASIPVPTAEDLARNLRQQIDKDLLLPAIRADSEEERWAAFEKDFSSFRARLDQLCAVRGTRGSATPKYLNVVLMNLAAASASVDSELCTAVSDAAKLVARALSAQARVSETPRLRAKLTIDVLNRFQTGILACAWAFGCTRLLVEHAHDDAASPGTVAFLQELMSAGAEVAFLAVREIEWDDMVPTAEDLAFLDGPAMDGLAACGVPGASGCSGATDTGTWYSYETGSSWYR